MTSHLQTNIASTWTILTNTRNPSKYYPLREIGEIGRTPNLHVVTQHSNPHSKSLSAKKKMLPSTSWFSPLFLGWRVSGSPSSQRTTQHVRSAHRGWNSWAMLPNGMQESLDLLLAIFIAGDLYGSPSTTAKTYQMEQAIQLIQICAHGFARDRSPAAKTMQSRPCYCSRPSFGPPRIAQFLFRYNCKFWHISTSFSQTKHLERELLLNPPAKLPPSLSPYVLQISSGSVVDSKIQKHC